MHWSRQEISSWKFMVQKQNTFNESPMESHAIFTANAPHITYDQWFSWCLLQYCSNANISWITLRFLQDIINRIRWCNKKLRENSFSCKVYFSSPSWQLKDKTFKSLQFQHAKQSFNKKTERSERKIKTPNTEFKTISKCIFIL